ncbi:unnamed protein product [Cladocopium goreaui]|uniref:Uncharacterized protein n=1 Tax=Cladocopium goreaui TaxID=2562237 RepID=A0A9P1DCB1_9DINO|nr:unnamed protein product [Cladocopium goreaui]
MDDVGSGASTVGKAMRNVHAHAEDTGGAIAHPLARRLSNVSGKNNARDWWRSFKDGPEMQQIRVPVKYQDLDDGQWKFRIEERPILDPHLILQYLFDDANVKIPAEAVRKYWSHHARHGEKWAQTCDNYNRIPVGIFGDSARVTAQYGKVVQVVVPPKLRAKGGQQLTRDSFLFCCTEIRGDWSWHKKAYQDFKAWCRANRLHCSQPEFRESMLYKKNGDVMLTLKAYNGRCVLEWLAVRVYEAYLNPQYAAFDPTRFCSQIVCLCESETGMRFCCWSRDGGQRFMFHQFVLQHWAHMHAIANNIKGVR